MSLATGHWQDVEDRNRKPVKPLLRTMSENPALEWNTNVQSLEESSEVVMVPLVYNVNIKLLFAPAIVHQKMDNNIYSEILVAGLSSEVNLMSDINFCISLQQLSFMSFFKDEIFSLFHFESKTEEKKRPKHSDSGLDSIREDESFKSIDNSCFESDKVPIEVLVTCTNVRVALHKYEKSNASVTAEDIRLWRRYHHANRVQSKVSRVSVNNSDESDEDGEDDRGERNVLIDPEVAPPEAMSTTGYEGSEDESTAEKKPEMKIRLIPLFSVCVTHPYVFVSINSSSQKIDFSLYNMTLATAPQGFHLPAKSGKKVPWIR